MACREASSPALMRICAGALALGLVNRKRLAQHSVCIRQLHSQWRTTTDSLRQLSRRVAAIEVALSILTGTVRSQGQQLQSLQAERNRRHTILRAALLLLSLLAAVQMYRTLAPSAAFRSRAITLSGGGGSTSSGSRASNTVRLLRVAAAVGAAAYLSSHLLHLLHSAARSAGLLPAACDNEPSAVVAAAVAAEAWAMSKAVAAPLLHKLQQATHWPAADAAAASVGSSSESDPS